MTFNTRFLVAGATVDAMSKFVTCLGPKVSDKKAAAGWWPVTVGKRQEGVKRMD